MIPKTIHYVWFGPSEKPAKVQKNIEDWKSKLPDYNFREWNDQTFPIDTAPLYVQQANKERKWAFVSDYIRLWVLDEFGGIYLDTDVRVIKSFDDLLGNESFLGRESESELCTAVIGSEPHVEWIQALLTDYRQRKFVQQNGGLDLTPNSSYIKSFLETLGVAEKPKIFPEEYFSPKSFYHFSTQIHETTYCIHEYNATWKTGQQKAVDFVLRVIGQTLGINTVVRLKKAFRR
ncbi:glycosyltransferase family 32 protein [Lacticaseibacillus hegangensis]|uniref:Glycosyltransferase family 32 protein n=1 Tax=Lacticaseibacillus hegangensis TaxID=2486010 RepID=A0ABW4CYV9_9LACO|nr:glycosyltransferase [Lacticaseibacillus hegangensis]